MWDHWNFNSSSTGSNILDGLLLLVLNQSPSGNQYSVSECTAIRSASHIIFMASAKGRAKKKEGTHSPLFFCHALRVRTFDYIFHPAGLWTNSHKNNVLAHFAGRPAFWAGSRSGQQNCFLSPPLGHTRTPLPAPLVCPGAVRMGVVCDQSGQHSIGRGKRS